MLWYIRQARSGAGVLGSIPIAVVTAVVFAILVAIRFASLMFTLKCPSKTESNDMKETTMNKHLLKVSASTTLETAWALGVSIAAGLLLPS